jgi:hypothetical protein
MVTTLSIPLEWSGSELFSGTVGIHLLILMMREVDKMFPRYQPCQLVKNYQHCRHHLCPHHQGLMMEELSVSPAQSGCVVG